jgi:DNA repair exonuclease SbcCD ATPase subunit
MKCPNCRAEIISNTVKTCPYCGSSLAVPYEKSQIAEHATNHEASEIAKTIKEAIEAQKVFYQPEKSNVTKKLKEVSWKKYSTSDIVILFVSLVLTFIVLTLTFFLLFKR